MFDRCSEKVTELFSLGFLHYDLHHVEFEVPSSEIEKRERMSRMEGRKIDEKE